MPLASIDYDGGKIPTSGHHVGKKPTDGYLFELSFFPFLCSGLNMKKTFELSFCLFVLWFKHEKDV